MTARPLHVDAEIVIKRSRNLMETIWTRLDEEFLSAMAEAAILTS
jgi:hypothetical protein